MRSHVEIVTNNSHRRVGSQRTLMKRMAEHKRAVKNGDTNIGIPVHAWEANLYVDLEGAKVREMEPHTWKRKVLEDIHIQTEEKNSILDMGLQLSHVWHPFMIEEQ